MEDELIASRAQLEATRTKLVRDRETAPASTADMIEDQIELIDMQLASIGHTLALLADARPAMAAAAAARSPMAPHAIAVMTPVPAAVIPSWIPDDTTRDQITHAMMRCPDGASVMEHDAGMSCVIAGIAGKHLGVRDGLTVAFAHSGRLTSQRCFDHGKLRWSIDYHLIGGRESAGHYVGTEKFDYTEHGLHTRYNTDGSVQSQIEYDHGKPHGWTRLYDHHGFPIVAERYEHGVVVESIYPDGSRAR